MEKERLVNIVAMVDYYLKSKTKGCNTICCTLLYMNKNGHIDSDEWDFVANEISNYLTANPHLGTSGKFPSTTEEWFVDSADRFAFMDQYLNHLLPADNG